MPKLSVLMIRAALIYMGFGFLAGSLLLWNKGFALYPWIWKLLNSHMEIMVFGWTIQLIMGVTFWILPRFSNRDNRYGAEYLAWWSFYLINSGVVLTVVADWYSLNWLASIGRLCILFAIVSFAIMIAPRVKPLMDINASQ